MQPMVFPPAAHRGRCARAQPAAQRGSLLIQFAVFVAITVLILGIVDLGYSFYAKRDLQRIADLAAIEAVQGIDPDNKNASCVAAGNRSVADNWPSPISPGTPSVICGEWNTAKYGAPRHFLGNATETTAAHVVLEGVSPQFIPITWNRQVRAEAIAQRTEAAASFQIGSQLLNLNKDAPLGRVLTLIGLDADKLTVLDSNGLANAKVSPSGLLKALGVDLGIEGLAVLTPQQLADLNNLSLLQIINASLEVISDNTLKADVRAAIDVIKDLSIDSVRLLDTKIPLLGDSSAGTPGILTFLSLGKTSSPNAAALDTQIGIGAILNTAIMIAANGHALQVEDTSLLNTVKLGLTVVEPPTIVVGRGTIGNSAQVRLNLDIDSKGLPLLGNLLDTLGVRINLPIKIDGVSADGMLNEDNGVNCRSNPPSLNVDVASRLAKITIGNPGLGPMDPSNLLIKTPLSVNVRGPISVSVLQAHDETLLDIAKNQSKWTQTNPLLLGDTAAALSDAVFQLLAGLFSPPIINANWQGMTTDGTVALTKEAQIEALAKLYLEETKVNGFYKIDPAINLMLKGRGVEGSDGYIGKLVNGDFLFEHAIPVMTCGLLGIGLCSSDKWATGTFSEALTAYTSKVYGLGLIGIPLGNGYTSCANLLSTLLAANSCVLSNLNNLLNKQSAHVNLSNANAEALKNNTCNGALCVLLRPLLTPLTGLLNGVGQALLSPLLKNVLGLELGRNEVKALDISCNTAELVF